MKTLLIRTSIIGVFLLSLLFGAVAGGGVWFALQSYYNLFDGSVVESCENRSEKGERTDTTQCIEDSTPTEPAFLLLGLVAAFISGVLSLLFLAVGIISLRRYRRRIRLEKQEAT